MSVVVQYEGITIGAELKKKIKCLNTRKLFLFQSGFNEKKTLYLPYRPVQVFSSRQYKRPYRPHPINWRLVPVKMKRKIVILYILLYESIVQYIYRMVSPVKNGRGYCCHESALYSVSSFQIVNL